MRLQRHLTETLGFPVEVTTNTSYDTLARDLMSGRLGAAWAPPFVCARVETMGVRVLVRGVRKGTSTYRAALLCRPDALERVRKLEPGLKALWVDRDSVGGFLLPQAYVRGRGLDPNRIFSTQAFAGSYRAAVEGVLAGKADLMSIYAPPASPDQPARTGLEEVLPEREGELAVVAFTDEAPNDGVAVAASTPADLCAALERALLAMPNSTLGVGILLSAFDVERFERAPPRGYRALYRVAISSV